MLGDTTCKEIVCEKVNDPKGIIDCTAELIPGESDQVYDINIRFNQMIDNLDFEEDKYVFEIRAKVNLYFPRHEMLTNGNYFRILETIVVVRMR